MRKYIIFIVFILWTLLHVYFLQLNSVLKIADSFAYLQMSHYLANFNMNWFWTGWFGFLYSLPIAVVKFVIGDDFLSAYFVNISLFVVSGVLLYQIWKRYLTREYNVLLMIVFFLSSTLIHYNINILSENIYLPLFLWFILFLCNYIDNKSLGDTAVNVMAWNSLWFLGTKWTVVFSLISGFFLALLYLTRWEAFIYVGSLFLLVFFLAFVWEFSFKKATGIFIWIVVSFFVFISPYIVYLHGITWDWWLTNKWSSNIRQANMRWVDVMDDSGFEKSVWELTEDKHHLIAGFAGWLAYDKPQTKESLVGYFLDNPSIVLGRFFVNQKKLYSQSLPKLILWDALREYQNSDSKFYNNKIFFVILILPLLLILNGVYKMIVNQTSFITISAPFFIVASVFFTLFFVIDRYFLIFIPVALLVMVYGIQEFPSKESFRRGRYISFLAVLLGIYGLGAQAYFFNHIGDDGEYRLKMEAGVWLKKNICKRKVCSYKVMERFPVVTYYSGTKVRWLTPYVENLDDLLEYAYYNKVDYLVVDSVDFEKYRPKLNFLLDSSRKYKGLKVLKRFEDGEDVVVLYEFER